MLHMRAFYWAYGYICLQAVNVFALLSVIALTSVILRIAWMALRRCMQNKAESQECVFFNTQLGRYAACLVLAMVFNSVAGIIGLQWFVSRGITEGLFVII